MVLHLTYIYQSHVFAIVLCSAFWMLMDVVGCWMFFAGRFCLEATFHPKASAYSLLPVGGNKSCFWTNRHCLCQAEKVTIASYVCVVWLWRTSWKVFGLWLNAKRLHLCELPIAFDVHVNMPNQNVTCDILPISTRTTWPHMQHRSGSTTMT